MHGYGMAWGFGWWWWWVVGFIVVLIIVLAIARGGGGSRPHSPEPSAQDLLRKRYAAGEISTEEYKERMAVLEGRH